MSDPLLVLRDAILQNPESPVISYLDQSGEIIEDLADAEYIRLGTSGLTFPRDCPTNFKSKRGAGPFYSLDAVVFVLKHRDDSFSVYLQEARKKGLAVVSLVDKKDLVDYLTTAGADSPFVDHDEALPTPVKGFKKLKRDTEERSFKETIGSGAVALKPRLVRDRNFDFISTTDFSFLHTAIKSALGITASDGGKKEKEVSNKKTDSKGKRSLLDQISSINRPTVGGQLDTESSKSESNSVPIIIIPNAPSSLINMYNVKDWLEKSKFVPPAEAKSNSTTKQSTVQVSHHFPGDPHPTIFQVIDTPSTLSSSDWKRVVGAIVLGNTWQFKGWKWSLPADIFANIYGFYVQWDDVQSDNVVSQWNVKRINVSRSKRHLDSTAVLDFWHHLSSRVKLLKQ